MLDALPRVPPAPVIAMTRRGAIQVATFHPRSTLPQSRTLTSTHRGHGHCLAKGPAPFGMFAELMGKEAGTNRARGGSMHIADPVM